MQRQVRRSEAEYAQLMAEAHAALEAVRQALDRGSAQEAQGQGAAGGGAAAAGGVADGGAARRLSRLGA